MNNIDNFELHEQSMNLSVIHTSYKLSRMYLQQKQELEELKEKYANLNTLFEDYLKCHRVMVEEIERLQMQKSINMTKSQSELGC